MKNIKENALYQSQITPNYPGWSETLYGPQSWWALGYGTPNGQALANLWADESGRLLPVYLNSINLKYIRDYSRWLYFFSEFYTGIVNLFQNYVVGPGYIFKVVPTKDNVSKKLVKIVQEYIDLTVEHNDVHGMMRESIYRAFVEGEIIVRVFDGKEIDSRAPEYYGDFNGMAALRFVEPDLLLSLPETTQPGDSFGIQCDPSDMHSILAYNICENPLVTGYVPTPVAPQDVCHINFNSNSSSKRGLPIGFQWFDNLNVATSLLQAMETLQNSRSKIAAIKRVKNGDISSVQQLVEKSTNISLVDPMSQQTLKIAQMPFGSVVNTTDSVEWEFPNINTNSEDSIGVLQATLRAIAASLGVSETMISAAADTNYASAIVSESPSYKTFTAWQKRIGDFWAGRRTKPNQGILWRALVRAVENGILPQNTLTDLRIEAIPPSLATRNAVEEATAQKLLIEAGVKSREDVCGEMGMDYEVQKQKMTRDTSLNEILEKIQMIKTAGIPKEGAVELFKKYYTDFDDSMLNNIFEEPEIPQTGTPAGKPETKVYNGGKPKAPKPPKPNKKSL